MLFVSPGVTRLYFRCTSELTAFGRFRPLASDRYWAKGAATVIGPG